MGEEGGVGKGGEGTGGEVSERERERNGKLWGEREMGGRGGMAILEWLNFWEYVPKK